MKSHIRLGLLLLITLALAACYVKTDMQGRGGPPVPLPSSSPLLVAVAVDESSPRIDPGAIEKMAVEALAAQNVRAESLQQVEPGYSPAAHDRALVEQGYRLLLQLRVLFWGSRQEVLANPLPPSVGSLEDDRNSMLYRQGTTEAADYPGPSATYKEVSIEAALLDLETRRVYWSGRSTARPLVVGRSFIYRRFNEGLTMEGLAKKCLKRIAGAVARLLPEPTAARAVGEAMAGASVCVPCDNALDTKK